jgi:hypothetical protein
MFAASKTDQNVAGGPPPSGDPYWTSVSLLTNFESNLTFQDESTNNFAVTRLGNAQPSLSSPFSGIGGSIYCDGTGDYLSVPSNTAFDFGNGDFTIEMWLRMPVSNSGGIITRRGSTFSWQIYSAGSTLSVYGNGASLIAASTTSVADNAWHHVAFVRSGGTLSKLYIDGVAGSTTTTAAYNYPADNGDVWIANDQESPTTRDVNCFVSNVRVVKGTAVYTANFTPPTAPLTAITNTSLLITGTGQGMFNNSTFVDQGPNALTVTATGAPVYSGLSPFGNTYPGSVLFNGSSQYLTWPSGSTAAFGTGNFTVECWVYLTSAPTVNFIIDFRDATHLTAPILLWGDITSGVLYWDKDSSGVGAISGTATWNTNTWYHIAYVRNSTTGTLYQNGVSIGSGTDSTNYTVVPTTSTIANRFALSYNFPGYISNLRIVKGTAVYTANFTPPTTPLTAITNTSLLVRGDTGAFYDLSNNGFGYSTNGTPVVTTQIKKYGNESGSFPASGSLSYTNNAAFQMGTADYTVEFWLYQTNVTPTQCLIELGRINSSGSTVAFQIDTIGGVLTVYGGPAISTVIVTAGSTQIVNNWYHVALTRASGSTKLFINGTQSGSTATDTTNYTQGYLWVGANAGGTTFYLAGYLDDIRITKGVARYTANFTPPTATFPTGP